MDLLTSKISLRTAVDLLKVIRGMRNGFYYGGKVRLMHSIVIAILFMKGSLWNKLKRVASLTLEHASRIAVFVGVYKTTLILLQRIRGEKHPLFSFVAGAVGGLVINIDGEASNVNQQISFYILSRMIIGMFRMLQDKGLLPEFNVNRTLSILGWGTVMTLFANDKSTLQPSLQQSMELLYEESDKVKDWTELLPFSLPKRVQDFCEKKFPSLKSIRRRTQEQSYQTIFSDQEYN